MSTPILLLPGEVLLEIAFYLDITEVLTLRQTCVQFFEVTRDKTLWIHYLQQQERILPLQSDPWSQLTSSPIDLPAAEIERKVRSANYIANAWPLPRKTSALKIQPEPAGSSLLGLQVFLDRWLLSVYSEGFLYVWDLGASQSATQRAKLELGSDKWSSFAAALEPEHNSIMIAITNASSQITKIYRVKLQHLESVLAPNRFEFVRAINTPAGSSSIRAISPSLQLVVFSTSDMIEIVKWRDDLEPVRSRVSLQTDDLEEMWNGIITIRLVDPYILVFKARSVELYPLSSGDTEDNAPDLPHLVHRFSSTNFRDISCSEILHSPECSPGEMETLKLCFLAVDVLQGVFQYLVHIRFLAKTTARSSSMPLAFLDVECIGVYPMANNINLGAIRPRKDAQQPLPLELASSSNSPSPSPLPTPSPTPNRHNLSGQATGPGIPNPSSRGFVSSVALGLQGKRAVWVERKRGSITREVLVWKTDRVLDDGDIMDQNLTMDANVVYVVSSYDLREDVTHCVIGEVSGSIVLANRTGNLFHLGLDRRARHG